MIDVVDYENPDNSVNVSKQDIENEQNGRIKMKRRNSDISTVIFQKF